MDEKTLSHRTDPVNPPEDLENDPLYRLIYPIVRREVEAEMRRDGLYRRLMPAVPVSEDESMTDATELFPALAPHDRERLQLARSALQSALELAEISLHGDNRPSPQAVDLLVRTANTYLESYGPQALIARS